MRTPARILRRVLSCRTLTREFWFKLNCYTKVLPTIYRQIVYRKTIFVNVDVLSLVRRKGFLMNFKFFAILLAVAGAGLFPNVSVSASKSDLEKLVASMPRGFSGIPSYWFEMRSAVGWEKMMLVLGYADNRSVCDYLKEIAYTTDPQREFRCSAAN